MVSKLKSTCYDIWLSNKNSPDGVYNLNLHGYVVPAYCEMKSGGWTRIFNKIDNSVFFDKDWETFRSSFGQPTSNFWLGLHNMHLLTRSRNMTLRMELSSKNFTTPTSASTTISNSDLQWIEYAEFAVFPESKKFELHLAKKKGGTLVDHSAYHSGLKFSTKDKDNDMARSNCAQSLNGGWWFDSCFYFCFTCEGLSISGHYRFEFGSYRFFKFIKMLIKPSIK